MNDQQLLRYSRHILLEGFDVSGQEALLQSHVLIIGAGGLGCPAALYLAAAGVGSLSIADDDVVELGNLQRQIAHTMADAGKLKVDSVIAAAQKINDDNQYHALSQRITADSLRDFIKVNIDANSIDMVLDCSDNFATRFMINQVCHETKTPLVSAAAIGMQGQVMVFDYCDDSPCYRCLYADAAQEEAVSCSNSGILAPVVGVVGSMQAVEAIKYLSDMGPSAVGYVQAFDFAASKWRKLHLSQDKQCPVCCRQ